MTEDIEYWRKFSLILSINNEPPRRTLQAFKECLRIDENDPVPAMQAARLLVESSIDDCDEALKYADVAIQRSKNSPILSSKKSLLSRCYLNKSVINAHIFERELVSNRHVKKSCLEKSLNDLNKAIEYNSTDHLALFHRALHSVNNRNFPSAIDDIKKALKLNPSHLPSIHLLLISLSALKCYENALTLCETNLHEFPDDLILLYIKCHLEQCLGDSAGLKKALTTALYMLECIKYSAPCIAPAPLMPPSQPQAITSNTLTSSILATTTLSTLSTTAATLVNADEKNNSIKVDSKSEFIDERRVWLMLAEIFIKMTMFSDADKCVNQASKQVTSAVDLCPQVIYYRGLLAKANKNLKEAKNYFHSSISLDPWNADVLRELAHVHYLLGSLEIAEKFLKVSLDIDTNSHQAWHYLSLVLSSSQQEEASECARRALELKSSTPAIRFGEIVKRLTFD